MKLEKDYAILETPQEAAVFADDLEPQEEFYATIYSAQHRATRPEVLAAITPKEGDAVFWWWGFAPNNRLYYRPLAKKNLGHISDPRCAVKANAITTGRTVGELRELLAWAKGE